jgi:hypothetical protein
MILFDLALQAGGGLKRALRQQASSGLVHSGIASDFERLAQKNRSRYSGPVRRTCLFCGGRATGQGEHALPKWRLREYWDPKGQFMQEIDGRPTLVGDGKIHWSPNLPRVMLPAVCGQQDAGKDNCNGWLNRTFEEPAQSYVRAAIDNLDALDSKGTRVLLCGGQKRCYL